MAAARTLAQRLVDRFGEPIETPFAQLTRLFPAPAVLALAEGDALGQLGIVKQRQAAIVGIARAVADKRVALHGGADVQATIVALKELPGIGDWTAQYIAMRALRWPDAFPAGDVALQSALGVRADKNPARAAEAASQDWKPWRSYAVIRAWSAPIPQENTQGQAMKYDSSIVQTRYESPLGPMIIAATSRGPGRCVVRRPAPPARPCRLAARARTPGAGGNHGTADGLLCRAAHDV